MSYFGEAFVVYQGHHGDIGAHRADVVLPGAAYTEKTALYVNTEGRVQETKRAIFPPGQALEDWKVVYALAEVLGQTLPYQTHEQLRARLITEFSHFAAVDARTLSPVEKRVGSDGRHYAGTFFLLRPQFYMTDPISRASKTMAQCTELVTRITPGKIAA